MIEVKAEVQHLVKSSSSITSKFDQITAHFQKQRSKDPNFTAILVTDDVDNANNHLQDIENKIAVGFRKGICTKRVQEQIDSFQSGTVQSVMLIIPMNLAETGLNLQRASTIYFTKPTLNTVSHVQMCNRISRAGTLHEHLEAITVFAKNTVEESIVNYHAPNSDRSMKSFETP